MSARKRRERRERNERQQREETKKDVDGRVVIGNSPDLSLLFGEKLAYHSAWTSPEAFATHIESLDEKKAWHQGGWDTSGFRDGFSGAKNMEEAVKLATNGWTEGIEKVSRLQGRILAAHPLRKQPKRFSVAGAYPDVARAVAGDPMNMVVPDQERSKRRPVITLLCNMCANAGVDKDAITNRAAVVAALVDHIEAAGFSCEVVSTALTTGGGWSSKSNSDFKCATSVVVKRSSQPVDIARLAFGLGHASFFRRMIFADWGGSETCRPLGSGLGHVQKLKDSPVKDVYVIPSCEGNVKKFNTEEAAETEGLEFLINSLRRQKCPAFPKPLEEKEEALLDERDDEFEW